MTDTTTENPSHVQPLGLVSTEGLDAGGADDSQFEAWFSEYSGAGKGTKQQMREAYHAGLREARDGHAGKLIDAWVNFRRQPMPWKKACEVVAIVSRLPDAERDRLIALDE